MISERISDYIPPRMKNFEYGYPHSNALLTFSLQKDSAFASALELNFTVALVTKMADKIGLI